MSNYFIVHGSFSNPFMNWFRYLFKELEKHGRFAYCPQFPIGIGLQNYDNWSKLMKYYVKLGIINDKTIIIGHSIAPIFVCRFLIENNIKVKKLVFVCGFNYVKVNKEYDAVNLSMYCDDIEKIHQFCNDIVCFYTNNDPYINYESEKDFANKVSTKQIVINNGGHLNSEFGYDEFPELLSEIL